MNKTLGGMVLNMSLKYVVRIGFKKWHHTMDDKKAYFSRKQSPKAAEAKNLENNHSLDSKPFSLY